MNHIVSLQTSRNSPDQRRWKSLVHVEKAGFVIICIYPGLFKMRSEWFSAITLQDVWEVSACSYSSVTESNCVKGVKFAG